MYLKSLAQRASRIFGNTLRHSETKSAEIGWFHQVPWLFKKYPAEFQNFEHLKRMNFLHLLERDEESSVRQSQRSRFCAAQRETFDPWPPYLKHPIEVEELQARQSVY